ncbi:hypothetical protein PtB15_17B66 [Puccinia triticina]|nr:hypothetical protein PtB15_17B66 [Puccinia triticina]
MQSTEETTGGGNQRKRQEGGAGEGASVRSKSRELAEPSRARTLFAPSGAGAAAVADVEPASCPAKLPASDAFDQAFQERRHATRIRPRGCRAPIPGPSLLPTGQPTAKRPGHLALRPLKQQPSPRHHHPIVHHGFSRIRQAKTPAVRVLRIPGRTGSRASVARCRVELRDDPSCSVVRDVQGAVPDMRWLLESDAGKPIGTSRGAIPLENARPTGMALALCQGNHDAPCALNRELPDPRPSADGAVISRTWSGSQLAARLTRQVGGRAVR